MIYFDNAATTFPKPPSVIAQVVQCLTTYCGNAGRGSHPLAMACAEMIYACREELSDFLGLGAPERIIFCTNTTHALNLALRGVLMPHSHILISELDHNATRRPVCALARERDVHYDIFPVLGLSTQEILQEIKKRIRPETVALICTHASNVCSVSLPVTEIGALCHANGLHFILDAAQSAGHLPIDMKAMHVSALAAPAHKGLFGLQGAGVLALGAGTDLPPLLFGGSGLHSLSPDMPEDLPERLEAGTLPTPCIAGLLAGLRFLREYGMEQIAAHEHFLFLAARERLESIDGIHIYEADHAGAVLLFSRAGYDASEMAASLSSRGICVRAGLHCAPLAHHALGTPADGAVRISFGPFNTIDELDALWRAMQ